MCADYGEKDNSDLAERFGVTKEDYPVYKMFLQGTKDPIPYTGDVKNADKIKKFVMETSGMKAKVDFFVLFEKTALKYFVLCLLCV